MPAPLPPHPDNPTVQKTPQALRLSFIEPAKISDLPGLNGRPSDPNLMQLDATFNPHDGNGQWGIFIYPQETWYSTSEDRFVGDQYEMFKRHVRRHLLRVTPDQFEFLMDYLHNYRILNIHLITGEVSAWREGDDRFPAVV